MRESVLRLAAMQSRQRTCVFDLSDHYDKNRYQVMCFEMRRFIVTHPIMGSCQKCWQMLLLNQLWNEDITVLIKKTRVSLSYLRKWTCEGLNLSQDNELVKKKWLQALILIYLYDTKERWKSNARAKSTRHLSETTLAEHTQQTEHRTTEPVCQRPQFRIFFLPLEKGSCLNMKTNSFLFEKVE